MASLIRDKGKESRHLRVQFFSSDGRRKTVRLGQMSRKAANAIRVKIEAIVSSEIGRTPIDDEASRWLETIGEPLAGRLAAVGLMEERLDSCLGPFLEHYDSIRTVKPATHTVWGHTRRNLISFFGEGRALRSITEGDAIEWREQLATVEELAEATIRKRCKFARQFFGFAAKKRLVSSNPFAVLKTGHVANRSRDYFVTEHEAALVLGACDPERRLIFALSRYGGLRCPSEHLAVRLEDINWERNRMHVRSPKTEHHPGHESRIVPIFAELRPFLEEAWELATPGQEFLIAKYRDAEANLRTQFMRIINRAGLRPWPKLFQNLRATRQTELEETFPTHVVCAWLGNSESVARWHYLQVTEDHLRGRRNQAQHAAESSGTMRTARDRNAGETAGLCRNAEKQARFEDEKMEPLGLEPRTNRL